MLKLKMLDTRNVEETKEPIDAPDRTGTWLRQLPSLPASTAYIHYPPYPYPKAPCSGLGMVYRDEKKKWRRVTADDIASPWPRRYSSPISWLWNSLHFNPPQIPGTPGQDLHLLTAQWDEHTLNTDVQPSSPTCVMDSTSCWVYASWTTCAITSSRCLMTT